MPVYLPRSVITESATKSDTRTVREAWRNQRRRANEAEDGALSAEEYHRAGSKSAPHTAR
jgi:hypothetical protein